MESRTDLDSLQQLLQLNSTSEGYVALTEDKSLSIVQKPSEGTFDQRSVQSIEAFIA